MIDYDNVFLRLIVDESNRFMKNNIKKPDTAYISFKWLVKVTANPAGTFCGYDKVYGLDLVYMETYGLTEIVVGCRKKLKSKGIGSIRQIKDK